MLRRVENYLNNERVENIFIISKTTQGSKIYLEEIKKNIRFKKSNFVLISTERRMMGLDIENSILLLCGKWYLNPIVNSNWFDYILHNTKQTIPIAEVPHYYNR